VALKAPLPPGWWPDRHERRCLLRAWLRRQRRPDQRPALPAAWRQQRRLLFWWTLVERIQDEPLLMLAALAALPAWLLLALLHWHPG